MKRPLLLILLLSILCIPELSYSQNKQIVRLDPHLKLLYAASKKDKSQPDTTTTNLQKFGRQIRNKYETWGIKEDESVISGIIEYEGNVNRLRAHGVKIRSDIAPFFTVDFPLSNVDILANLEGMISIEMAKPVQPELDVSSDYIRAAEARNFFGTEGEGVIIGIIDSGIDHEHPAFRTEDGNSIRIISVWDQILSTSMGTPPTGYDYGVEWSRQELLSGNVPNNDNQGHGTHVAGIAAGNGMSSSGTTDYVGIAPKSELIIVKNNINREPFPETTNTADVVDGIIYIANKAKDLNKPWVVNLSQGTSYGPRNGTSLYERTVTQIVNNGSLGKGRVIVKSAGNEGYQPNNAATPETKKIHAESNGPAIKDFEVYESGSSVGTQVGMEVYYSSFDNYAITLISPNGNRYGPVTSGDIYADGTSDGWVLVDNFAGGTDYYHEGYDAVATILLNDYDPESDGVVDQHLSTGTWQIEISNSMGEWDAYLTGERNVRTFFTDQSYSNRKLITEPGNARNVITVGSINTKNNWTGPGGSPSTAVQQAFPIGQISSFSSPGPSRSGLNKPNIYAPGAYIASAKSSQKTFTSGNSYTQNNNSDYYYNAGTSMAAPHVTGAVALLMEKWIINQNENYGYTEFNAFLNDSKDNDGVVDVYEALFLNTTPTGIEDEIKFSDISYVQIVPGSDSYSFEVNFYDSPPESTGEKYEWELRLHHSGGFEKVIEYTDNYGGYSSYFSVQLAAHDILDSHDWVRNSNGDIKTEVYVSCTDSDGFIHSATLDVGVAHKPNQAEIFKREPLTNSMKLSYISPGATSYEIYYGTEPNINTATMVSTTNDSFTISGLDFNTNDYSFWVKGINQYGSGKASNPYFYPNPPAYPRGSNLSYPIDMGYLSIGDSYFNTQDNSTNNNFGNLYTGKNNQPSDDIFYKFSLNSQSMVEISLCNSEINDSYIHLLDANGNHIISNDDNTNCRDTYKSYLKELLSPGDYFLVVEGYGTSSGPLTTELNVGPEEYKIDWTDLVGVSVSSQTSTLTKTSTSYSWNAGAASINTIPPYNHGWAEFTISSLNDDIMFGLSYTNDDASWNTIDFNFYVSSYRGNQLLVYERGNLRYSSSTNAYSVGDRFRVERIGGTIYFKHNGNTIYTLGGDRTKPLLIDVSLWNPNSRITNPTASHGDNSQLQSMSIQSMNNDGARVEFRPMGNDGLDTLSVSTMQTSKPLIKGDFAAVSTDYSVSPNPSKGKFTLEKFSDVATEVSIEVISLGGRSMYKRLWSLNTGNNSLTINLMDYPSGSYMIKIIDHNRPNILHIIKI